MEEDEATIKKGIRDMGDEVPLLVLLTGRRA